MALRERFWEEVEPSAMSPEEWEALCDGCGRCCTVVLEDEETAELFATRVACRLLDRDTCQCSDYANRTAQVPWCIRITPENAATLDWLPQTCGYRRVVAGLPLPPWHHLVGGDRDAVHRLGPSLRGNMVSEVAAGDDLEAFILDGPAPGAGSED
jgi:uncharacterized protein